MGCCAGAQTCEPDDAVIGALEDDLNTPTALAAINGLARELARATEADKPPLAAKLRASAGIMNLLQQDPEHWFEQRQAETDLDEVVIEDLIERRDQARNNRDFAEADRIRDELTERGITIKDGPDGSRWEVSSR